MSHVRRRIVKSVSSRTNQNSLGAQARGLDAILDELDRQSSELGGRQRTQVRWPFRHESIRATLVQPDGGSVQMTFACRNLSVGGISILHRSFLHPGTRITLDLPKSTSGTKPVSGKVARCVHVQGTIHEVGVKFDELINLREFTRSDPFRSAFAFENVDPKDLGGTMIHIDPSQIDRQILLHTLRESSLSIRGCESVEEATPYIERGCDLIISEYNLGTQDAAMFAMTLRAEGTLQPIIVMSANRSKVVVEMITRSPVDVFLDKPVQQEKLFSAIAEFLAPGSHHANQKCVETSNGLSELAGLFANELSGSADRLEAALYEPDPDAILQLATSLKGTALALGFNDVGLAASELTEMLDGDPSLERAACVVRKLVTACRQSKHDV